MRSKIVLKKKIHQKQYLLNKSLENRRIAKTRRQRGYNWEDTLVKRFNKLDSWKAFRLGSPSVALPDILCVNNHDSKIFTIEAKSGTGTTLTVPFDQIIRCMSWTENFTVYKIRKVIFAFKFLSKKRIGKGDIVCKYDGTVYGLINGDKITMELKDYQMPFNSRHQKIL